MRVRGGYILAGGKSSRFGRDKALVEVGGRPLILRVVEPVTSVCRTATIVGSPGRYTHLGLPVIPDAFENVGPLAGILAALEDSSCPWNLVVGCDMPFLNPTVLEFLFREAENGSAAVVMPLSPAGLDEPLCAVYSTGAAAAVRQAIEGGERKITRALGSLQVARVPPEAYRHLDPEGRCFLNINTVEDWEAAGIGDP